MERREDFGTTASATSGKRATGDQRPSIAATAASEYEIDYAHWMALPASCKLPIKAYDLLDITPTGVTINREAVSRLAASLRQQYPIAFPYPAKARLRARQDAWRQHSNWLTAICDARLRIKASERMHQSDLEMIVRWKADNQLIAAE